VSRYAVLLFGMFMVVAAPSGSAQQPTATSEPPHIRFPVYPPIAATNRIEGVVVLSVITDRQDRFVCAKVISGHPMLTQAAIESAKTWHFGSFRCNIQCEYDRMEFEFKLDDKMPIRGGPGNTRLEFTSPSRITVFRGPVYIDGGPCDLRLSFWQRFRAFFSRRVNHCI
jgi:hypothetical protein